MEMARGRLRDRLLDIFILLSAIVMVLGSAGTIIFCMVYLEITNWKPYALYLIVFFLGIQGFRYYRKEVEF
jgi:hypothetical protein